MTILNMEIGSAELCQYHQLFTIATWFCMNVQPHVHTATACTLLSESCEPEVAQVLMQSCDSCDLCSMRAFYFSLLVYLSMLLVATALKTSSAGVWDQKFHSLNERVSKAAAGMAA